MDSEYGDDDFFTKNIITTIINYKNEDNQSDNEVCINGANVQQGEEEDSSDEDDVVLSRNIEETINYLPEQIEIKNPQKILECSLFQVDFLTQKWLGREEEIRLLLDLFGYYKSSAFVYLW